MFTHECGGRALGQDFATSLAVASIAAIPRLPQPLALASLLKQRLELCKSKGFVGVVPDSVDAYSNANGIGLTALDQLSYNQFLADSAHTLGLAIGLRNDLEQIQQLLPSFDFFVNE
jgi:hypothetical protein